MGAIPDGWVLCDGTNGTPDFRGVYLRVAHAGKPAGSTGGSYNHTHNFIAGGHSHNLVAGDDLAEGEDFANVTDTENPLTTTGGQSTALLYHTFDLIMKT
jgi:hypothetical protein